MFKIELKNLSRTFQKGIKAVDDISLGIHEGEMFGFLGPNGAGKTTTLKMLCGLCKPSSGDVLINGIKCDSRRKIDRSKIGVVSQNSNMDLDLTVEENLKIHSLLFGLDKKTERIRMEDYLSYISLSSRRKALVRSLSGGMKRALQIVRAILHDPEILFLDEPTSGIDPFSRYKIWDLLKKLRSEGKTIIFSTHYMEEAENYSERIALMNNGSITVVDSPENLIAGIGNWCREIFHAGKTQREYFDRKKQAESFDFPPDSELIIRKTQLEDVFLKLTGETKFI